MSSHAVLSSLYGLSRRYACKKTATARIFYERGPCLTGIGHSQPAIDRKANDRRPADRRQVRASDSASQVHEPALRHNRRVDDPAVDADAASKLCRSRSSANGDTNENSRFRAARFDRRRRREPPTYGRGIRSRSARTHGLHRLVTRPDRQPPRLPLSPGSDRRERSLLLRP